VGRPVGDNGRVTSAADLPSRLIGLEHRIPTSLADLRGPQHGVVAWPVRLPWVGLDTFDLDNPAQRLTFYRLLMDCGQREDLIENLNADLLRIEWPRIRRLTGRAIIARWERMMPPLATCG
jgi:hypothetical protein